MIRAEPVALLPIAHDLAALVGVAATVGAQFVVEFRPGPVQADFHQTSNTGSRLPNWLFDPSQIPLNLSEARLCRGSPRAIGIPLQEVS